MGECKPDQKTGHLTFTVVYLFIEKKTVVRVKQIFRFDNADETHLKHGIHLASA